jgi:hypothetical protein
MNLSAGTGVPVFSNTTTRDAGFGGAGEKVLAEGQLCYLSSTNVVQYYDGAAWATVGPANAGALTLITAQVIGTAVSSVTVSSAFSATYDNYKITVSGGVGSTAMAMLMTLGATSAGYYWGLQGADFAGGASANGASNTSSWRVGGANTTTFSTTMDLMSPNLAKNTAFASTYLLPTASTAGVMGNTGGFLNDNTQYTAFTLTPSTGTLTGGTIRVYGYSNS